MLRALVDLALRQRHVVVLAAGVLLFLGGWTTLCAPLDVFPEFAPPIVEVPPRQVEGLASRGPVDAEQLVPVREDGAA